MSAVCVSDQELLQEGMYKLNERAFDARVTGAPEDFTQLEFERGVVAIALHRIEIPKQTLDIALRPLWIPTLKKAIEGYVEEDPITREVMRESIAYSNDVKLLKSYGRAVASYGLAYDSNNAELVEAIKTGEPLFVRKDRP